MYLKNVLISGCLLAFGLLLNAQTQIRLIPSDSNGQEGNAVSIDGDWAMVGAAEVDDFDGAVYVFRKYPQGWIQTQKIPRPVDSEGIFGADVEVKGNKMIIGAAYGSASIFVLNGTTWTKQATVRPNFDNIGGFGHFVSISGNRAVVGAHYTSINGEYARGAAYVFHFNGENWMEFQQLTAEDGAGNHNFGNAVKIYGDWIAVGTPRWDGSGTYQGAAYLYQFDGTVWNLSEQKTSIDVESFDFFGTSVDIYEDWLIIGAPGEGTFPLKDGSVYLFKLEGNEWLQKHKVKSQSSEDDDDFGYSVSIQSEYFVVGMPESKFGSRNSPGAVSIFKYGEDYILELDKLTPSNGHIDDFFGYSVGLFQGNVIVGAYNTVLGNGLDYYGSVYMYNNTCIDIPFTIEGFSANRAWANTENYNSLDSCYVRFENDTLLLCSEYYERYFDNIILFGPAWEVFFRPFDLDINACYYGESLNVELFLDSQDTSMDDVQLDLNYEAHLPKLTYVATDAMTGYSEEKSIYIKWFCPKSIDYPIALCSPPTSDLPVCNNNQEVSLFEIVNVYCDEIPAFSASDIFFDDYCNASQVTKFSRKNASTLAAIAPDAPYNCEDEIIEWTPSGASGLPGMTTVTRYLHFLDDCTGIEDTEPPIAKGVNPNRNWSDKWHQSKSGCRVFMAEDTINVCGVFFSDVDYKPSDIIFTDNCDDNLTVEVELDTIDYYFQPLGIRPNYCANPRPKVTWTASDASGNSTVFELFVLLYAHETDTIVYDDELIGYSEFPDLNPIYLDTMSFECQSIPISFTNTLTTQAVTFGPPNGQAGSKLRRRTINNFSSSAPLCYQEVLEWSDPRTCGFPGAPTITRIYEVYDTLSLIPIELTVHDNVIPSDTYYAQQTVISHGAIRGSDHQVIFKSGNEIILEEYFEVELGSEFEALIDLSSSCCDNAAADLLVSDIQKFENYGDAETVEDASTTEVSLFPVSNDILTAFPNPFNDQITINYSITKTGFAQLQIYSLDGKFTQELVAGIEGEGDYTINLSSSNWQKGIYFLTLQTDNGTAAKKIVLLR